LTRRHVGPAPTRRLGERGPGYAATITGPIVVDASIAVLWFANELDRAGAARLLESTAILLAPDLMAVEATNAWWKKLRHGEMERPDVEQAVTNLLAVGISWTPSAVLLRLAARLAIELGHPVYDCLYLALATARSASLATADDRLGRTAARLGVRRWGETRGR
jgi:predicted nucleic acid-binding protein